MLSIFSSFWMNFGAKMRKSRVWIICKIPFFGFRALWDDLLIGNRQSGDEMIFWSSARALLTYGARPRLWSILVILALFCISEPMGRFWWNIVVCLFPTKSYEASKHATYVHKSYQNSYFDAVTYIEWYMPIRKLNIFDFFHEKHVLKSWNFTDSKFSIFHLLVIQSHETK